MKKIRIWMPVVLGFLGLAVVLYLVSHILQFFAFNLFWIVPGLYFIFFLVLFALNLLFAQGIMRDAAAQTAGGKRTFFVAPEIWGLATVIGGFFVVILYWVFHHSTLRRA